MNKIVDFFADGQRVLIDIGLWILFGLAGWVWGYYENSQALQDCQADRVELQKQHATDQAFQHSVYYGQQITALKQQLHQKDEANLQLQQQHRLDSAAVLSLTQSMAAINARYR